MAIPTRNHFFACARGALFFFICGLIISGCTRALPEEIIVGRVVDGDTVQLSDGRLLRYCGIDAPEVRRRRGGRWVMDPEPFGKQATELNRRLVGGRRVRIEYDVQTHDRFGRLLGYVYVGDAMVNLQIIRAGLAVPLEIAPNLRYAKEFRILADEARRAKRGIWNTSDAQ